MHKIIFPVSKTRRFIETYKHPDQAAVAARLPLVRRRVPMQRYWRTQPVAARRVMRRVAANMRGAVRTAGFGGRMGLLRLRERRARARNREPKAAPANRQHQHRHDATERHSLRERWTQRPRLGAPMLLAGACLGGAAMFLLDPVQGRRRRALIRDKAVHLRHVMTRDVPTRVEKRGRFFRGVAKGVVHDTTDALAFSGHPLVDDETLVARVRSEVLRDHALKAGEIHVDAYEGCVTLRGQLEPAEIRRLVHDASRVAGVREVRNFLHTPGTLPPNKAEVYAAGSAQRQPRP